MARQHEISRDPQKWDSHGGGTTVVASSPRNPSAMAALMECAPGHEPATSQDDLYPLREILQDAIELVLDEREQWVFNAHVVERLSVREIGRQLSLGKSQVHRIYVRCCQKLEDYLYDDPDIHNHLKGQRS